MRAIRVMGSSMKMAGRLSPVVMAVSISVGGLISPAAAANAAVTTAIDRSVALGPSPFVTTTVAELSPPTGTTSPYAMAVLADKPNLYWRLDEPTGITAVDSSGHGNDGTYGYGGSIAAPTSATSKVDSDGAKFISDFRSVESNSGAGLPIGGAPRTLEMWVQSNGNSFGTVIGGYGSTDSIWLNLRAADQIYVWTGSVAHLFPVGRMLNDDSWHQIAISYADGVMNAFVDGAAIGAWNITLNTLMGNCGGPLALHLGGQPCEPSAYNAFLDEVAMYPTALSPAQIANHYLAAGYSAGGPLTARAPSELYGGSNYGATTPPARCSCGDPVDGATGNFSETVGDLAVPGRGRPLMFTRSYNALEAASASAPNALGYGWTDSYASTLTTDSIGNVTVHQGNGSTVPFVLAGSAYNAPPRVLATLHKNSDGTFTYILPSQRSDVFSAAGQLLSQSDRNGYVTTLAYAGGKLSSVTDPAGRALTFSYDATGHLIKVADPAGRNVQYQYDAGNNLVAVSEVVGGTTRYTYDATHRLLTATDPKGGVTTNIYDGTNRVTSQTDPLQRTYTWQYASDSTTITDPRGNVILTKYTDNALVSRTMGVGTPAAATWAYGYDAAGNVTSTTDPNGHLWQSTWDERGNVLSRTDPLNPISTSSYDAFNDVTSATDPAGVTSTMTYDARGNLLSASRPLTGTGQSATATFSHGDPAHTGDVTAATDPNGQTTQFAYDAQGDLDHSTDPLGNVTTMQYDGIGRMTAQVSPAGHTTTFAYDAYGGVTAQTDPLGHKTSSQYDANHNMVTSTDADGHTTTFEYDGDNERIAVIRADKSTLTNGYDAHGNLVVQKDGLGNPTSYSYDALNRVVATTDPLGRVTSYGYDKAGNFTSFADPQGQVTSYSYDAANQMVGVTYSDGRTPNVSFAYDADGQRVRMTDGTGTSLWAYDSLNRLTESINGAGASVRYGHDFKGQLTSITYPNSGTVARSYDADGRVNKVTDWLRNTTTFAYDPDSHLITQTTPSTKTVTDTFGYDSADRLTSIKIDGPQKTLASFMYGRDAANLLTSEASTGERESKELYKYTPLNQLHTEDGKSYGYDAADNITALLSGATLSYNAANEVTALTKGSLTSKFSFDPRGNRVTKTPPSGASVSYVYDQANRLIAFDTGATYAYNGDGLRMNKTLAGVAEPFAWDVGDGLPLMLEDAETSYVYGPGGLPLEQISASGAAVFYHHDQLGSTRLLTDFSGKVAGTHTYDGYGNTTAKTGKVKNPLGYAGQYTDTESGLQYLHARYYDSTTGQFLTRDPMVAHTRSPYLYVDGNPLNFRDPRGLDCDVNPFSGNSCIGNVWAHPDVGAEQYLQNDVPFSPGFQAAELHNVESLFSSGIYAVYRAGYEINSRTPQSWRLLHDFGRGLQYEGIRGDITLDEIQVATGYPDTSVCDEGMPVSPFPSLILPGGIKIVQPWIRSPGPGVHPNGYVDIAN